MPRHVASLGLLGLAVLGTVGWLEAQGSAKPPADYRIAIPGELSLEVGATDAISLTIAARPGFSVSKDAPVTVALAVEPAEGLALHKTRYARKDAADVRAADPRFDLRVRGVAAGAYQLRVRARFWVCGDRTCRPVDDSRVVKTTVREPAPPAAGPDAGPRSAPTP